MIEKIKAMFVDNPEFGIFSRDREMILEFVNTLSTEQMLYLLPYAQSLTLSQGEAEIQKNRKNS